MPIFPKLRVGIVDYLNAWPLAWGFLTGELDNEFEALYLPPADVARELAAGHIDIGLVPSIEVQRLQGLWVVPDLCVASTHEVRSVILISRCPLDEIRRVALDRNSRTSAALVEILLQAHRGHRPEVTHAWPDADRMLADADAALIIGDAALQVDRDRYRVWDLAAQWRLLTGSPFVFAVWAGRSEVRDRGAGVADLLAKSLQFGMDRLDDVVSRGTAELGLGEEVVREYLTRNLSFRLDDAALTGLSRFYERAAALDLIDGVESLDFLAVLASEGDETSQEGPESVC